MLLVDGDVKKLEPVLPCRDLFLRGQWAANLGGLLRDVVLTRDLTQDEDRAVPQTVLVLQSDPATVDALSARSALDLNLVEDDALPDVGTQVEGREDDHSVDARRLNPRTDRLQVDVETLYENPAYGTTVSTAGAVDGLTPGRVKELVDATVGPAPFALT